MAITCSVSNPANAVNQASGPTSDERQLLAWLKRYILTKVAAMFTKRTLSAAMMIVLAIVAFFAWIAWNEDHLGWAHIFGLGASVLLFVLIWFWPGNRQPTQPPP